MAIAFAVSCSFPPTLLPAELCDRDFACGREVERRPAQKRSGLERVERIELPLTAWKAVVLPLNYTRTGMMLIDRPPGVKFVAGGPRLFGRLRNRR
jgi:hypothetical protein